MEKKLFEVFLGTYNAAPWIEQVIHSLESQDCGPFTVNIIDNASSDETVAKIENIFANFQMRNEYRLVKNKKNIGPISTFLDQLELFQAEWIFMVHQDDYYHPDHFSTLISEIEKSPESVGLVFTAMKRIDQNNIEIFNPPTLSSKISDSNRFENFLLALQINPVNFPSCAL